MSTLAYPNVEEILEGVLAGRRLSDEDALALLASRDLVAVGEAARAKRDATSDPA